MRPRVGARRRVLARSQDRGSQKALTFDTSPRTNITFMLSPQTAGRAREGESEGRGSENEGEDEGEGEAEGEDEARVRVRVEGEGEVEVEGK